MSRRVKSALAWCTLTFAPAMGEPLYSNGGPNPGVPALSTGAVTQSGIPAGAGKSWSEVPREGQDANLFAGFSCHPDANSYPSAAFRFADDFTVTGANGWRLSRAVVYAYAFAESAESPFASVTIRIWTGLPGGRSSLVAFGDTITNRLLASTPSNIYRVFNTTPLPAAMPPDQSRLIWANTVDLGDTFLPPGQYWMDWQITCVDPDAAAFAPAATIAGSRSAPGANALHLRPDGLGAGWMPLVDPGKSPFSPDAPQDLPFLLDGTEPAAPCPADFNGDGGVDGQDVEAFFRAWVVARPDADTNADGGIDGADVETFFNYWEAGGC